MKRKPIRVILASAQPQACHLLRQVIAQEEGAVVVGQAENARRALTLTKKLRPDIAIIDCYLPHSVSLGNVPLSRIGGLDTAQTIVQHIPSICVVLLNNLDSAVPEFGSVGGTAAFARRTNGSSTTFTLEELCQEVKPMDLPVFAEIKMVQETPLRQKVSNAGNKAIVVGGLGFIGGVLLILTVALGSAGIFLAAAGAATMLLGLAGKLTAKLLPKIRDNS